MSCTKQTWLGELLNYNYKVAPYVNIDKTSNYQCLPHLTQCQWFIIPRKESEILQLTKLIKSTDITLKTGTNYSSSFFTFHRL